MRVFITKVDITNTTGAISKEIGQVVEAGTILEFEEVPERILQLVKLGVINEVEEFQVIDPADDQDPQDPPADDQDPTDQIPDHFVDILDNNVDNVIETLKVATQEDLILFHKLETEGKNRKTVIEYINGQLSQ